MTYRPALTFNALFINDFHPESACRFETCENLARRGNGLIDLRCAVSRRHESRLKSRWREIDALGEHGVEEAVERVPVALHDLRVARGRGLAEVDAKHAANILR